MLLRGFFPTIAAVALMPVMAVAQTDGAKPEIPSQKQTSPNPAQEIKDRLAAQGYSDIKVEPASYLVHATDKNGNSFLVLIGPDAMTMLSMEKNADADSENPSIAEQKPDSRDKLIFQ